ncbi:unnamed protein product [Microthlaspi erraticum]|uniref:Uncharacterized protein n=1 Tax=Microthlaspi erraticum TaxID=1685480 RepID=A0A6D2HPN4_9BRAS|nr:unnamed protein product [Microthlaspi erraticum]
MMLSKDGIEDVMKQGWEGNGGNIPASLLDRITNYRRALSKWKINSDQNYRLKITRLYQKLESEICKVHPNYRRIQSLKHELASAHKDEEFFWRQKSHEQWLRAGDKNTNYFHNCVKGKKIQNRILMLKDESGHEHFSEGAKGNIASDYFQDLFMSSNPFDLFSRASQAVLPLL